MEPIRYFSTFTGVGGFEIGIQKAIPGAICVGMSEIDNHAKNVLRYKFKGVKNYGDITKIKPETLPDFDILCGGFPCQSFSIAGKRMGFEDTRGTLFFELARIAKCKQPSILFFENVKGLLSHKEGRTITTILKTLDELGYDAEWQVLNSKHCGVPQNRERIIIIGHLRGKPRLQVFPIPRTTRGSTGQSKGQKGLKEVTLQGTPQWERVYDAEGVASTLTRTGSEKGLYKIKEERKPVVFDRGKIRETEQSTCIDAHYYKGADQHGARTHVQEGTTIRRLTPIECERLQGFQEDWTKYGLTEDGTKVQTSDNQRYKMMGNAVTTNVIECVAGRIRLSLSHQEENECR